MERLLGSVQSNLDAVRQRTVHVTIFKVPNKLRNVMEEAYSPRIVSIGPFHQGKHELLAMEEHKWRYMLSFVRRSPDEVRMLEECCHAVFILEVSARGCYAENILSENMPLEVLLVDACFIIELFIRYPTPNFKDEDDPIGNNAWMIPALQHDLALLENQIPFFVLDKLFRILLSYSPITELPFSSLALHFFYPEAIISEVLLDSRHLLDLLHKFYLRTAPAAANNGNDNWGFRDCATKLLEAGIRFERGETAMDGLRLDISFSDGVIKIPPLSVAPTTESLLRNLIALEQCSFGLSHPITSYAFLINGLIRSSADVELLQRRGIIVNNLGLGEEIFPIINILCKEVVLKDFYFNSICEKVNSYRRRSCQFRRRKASLKLRRYYSILKRDYFSNPWSIISVAAAVVLLILTGIQTFYSVRGYYPH